MDVRISNDLNFIHIDNISQHEYQTLQYGFTKKVQNYHIIKKKMPHFSGEICFLNEWTIPMGLWCELMILCEKNKFPLNIHNNEWLYDRSITDEFIQRWLNENFTKTGGMYPYYYQYEAVQSLAKYRKCVIEVSTSGGKTFISYLFFRLLKDYMKVAKQLLIIVPSNKLLSQAYADFQGYITDCGHEEDLKFDLVSGDYKPHNTPGDANIIIGTYQSLSLKHPSYFEDVDVIICDETHHAQNKSYRTVIKHCKNAKYRVGMTGTLPPSGSCENFTIQSYLGPRVYNITSKQLIDEGYATPIYVKQYVMSYTDDNIKENLFLNRVNPSVEGSKSLELEIGYMRQNENRFNFVCSVIKEKQQKNALVIYQDIKTGYGLKVYNRLRESMPNRTIFYVDGGVATDRRDYYIEQMEKNEDVIIVASMGTFSEGVSIKNLHEVYVVECGKSDQIVGQLLGRGMRLLRNKIKTHVDLYDFVDDYHYTKPVDNKFKYKIDNFILKHGKERLEIYKKREFPYEVIKVNF